MGHIHVGAAGVNGPVVFTLFTGGVGGFGSKVSSVLLTETLPFSNSTISDVATLLANKTALCERPRGCPGGPVGLGRCFASVDGGPGWPAWGTSMCGWRRVDVCPAAGPSAVSAICPLRKTSTAETAAADVNIHTVENPTGIIRGQLK
jgi:hypothetical protein